MKFVYILIQYISQIQIHKKIQKHYFIQYNFDPNSNSFTSKDNVNTSMTHNASIDEDLESFQIGSPVFTTGIMFIH